MHRAVLDSNVFVSGAIAEKGAPGEILTAWREGRFELVTSVSILDEVERVLRLPRLTRTYRLTPEEVRDLLRLLRTRAVVVPGQMRIPRTARDPEDDAVLGCAVEGNADHVVTGDQDLLVLRRFQGIPIVPPAAFRGLLLATP